jgi:hypothetical protein
MRAVPAGDNMAQHAYTVRRSFLIPLGVDVLLLLCLFVLSLVQGSATERLVFGIFFFPALYLLLEGILRRVTLDEGGIAVRKLGRAKGVSWDQVNHVGLLALHKKVYLLLTTGKGLFIISNAYGDFSSLAQEIVSRVDPARVEEEVRLQATSSPSAVAPIVMAWVAGLFMVGILLMKVWLQ